MRRVTFSRNYTLSLSRTCQCYCKYCAFATHRAHIHDPDEVERRLDEAVRRNAKELLVLTGERPEVNPEVAERLRELGSRGLHLLRRLGLPAGHRARPASAHEPRRALARGPGAAARGDRLAGPDARVDQSGPGRPPGVARPSTRRSGSRRSRLAGELRIPFTTRDPGRDRRERGGAGRLPRGDRRGPRRVRPHPGGDPPELRPASALLRRGGRGDRGRGLRGSDGPNGKTIGSELPLPEWATPGLGRRHEAADRRVAAADARRRRPGAAEPRRLVARAGRGGRHRPRRAVRQRRPHQP